MKEIKLEMNVEIENKNFTPRTRQEIADFFGLVLIEKKVWCIRNPKPIVCLSMVSRHEEITKIGEGAILEIPYQLVKEITSLKNISEYRDTLPNTNERFIQHTPQEIADFFNVFIVKDCLDDFFICKDLPNINLVMSNDFIYMIDKLNCNFSENESEEFEITGLLKDYDVDSIIAPGSFNKNFNKDFRDVCLKQINEGFKSFSINNIKRGIKQ
ncbi:hypothetical protein [Treponema peruense]|uniref:Uncharacterized protein n=1 Tax=Treponema peruense TaxID=2787628 RepID=A0A7T3REK6_9SPIR|nr:hypothetical protein [Treponema peruense]QQA01679.1 hypothetical protein IWA51_03450 [Treponema peruense]